MFCNKGKCMVNECILVQTVIFIFSGSHLGALPFQGSDSAKTDTSPSGSPWKCQNFECRVQSSPFLPRKMLGAGGVPLDHVLCQEKGLWWEGATKFPTNFDASGFELFMGCRHLSADVWISWKGKQSVYCCRRGLSIGGRKVWSLQFCHLAHVQHQLFFE